MFADPNAFRIFILLLMDADRHGSGKFGRKRICAELGMKESTFYSALLRLRGKYQILQLESNNKSTTYHIRNFKDYQQESNKKATDLQQRGNTIQERRKKNIKEKINKKEKSYVTDEYIFEHATEKKISKSNAKRIREDLFNYVDSKKPGYKDLRAAYRTFVNKAIERDKSLVLKVSERPPQVSEDSSEEVDYTNQIQQIKNQHGFLS